MDAPLTHEQSRRVIAAIRTFEAQSDGKFVLQPLDRAYLIGLIKSAVIGEDFDDIR